MRKLLGYRLKDSCENYKSAALDIVKSSLYFKGESNWFGKNSLTYRKLEAAGVMHWFEEVYEDEKRDVSGWVKHKEYDNTIFHNSKGYGIWHGKWRNNLAIGYTSLVIPATTEEIQQALIKEAKKRGFKEGFMFKSIFNNSTKEFKGSPSFHDHLGFNLYGSDYNGCIFDYKTGKWAEILPNKTLNGKTAIIDGVEYELKIK